MSYTLIAPDAFRRRLRKFLKQHRDLVDDVHGVLSRLETDPFDPQLHLHPLGGQLTGWWAVRITYSYRVVLILELTEQEITLLDIGSHDDVYR